MMIWMAHPSNQSGPFIPRAIPLNGLTESLFLCKYEVSSFIYMPIPSSPIIYIMGLQFSAFSSSSSSFLYLFWLDYYVTIYMCVFRNLKIIFTGLGYSHHYHILFSSIWLSFKPTSLFISFDHEIEEYIYILNNYDYDGNPRMISIMCLIN